MATVDLRLDMKDYNTALEKYAKITSELGIESVNLPLMDICAHCESVFFKHSGTHKYCKTSCRVAAYNKRRRSL